MGTILNLYIEDNRGCFPVYDNDFDIIWFLRGAIARSDGEDEESLQPVEVRGIACCPMAVRLGKNRLGYTIGDTRVDGFKGSTFKALEITSPGRPFRTSYGFNGWLFCCDFDASIPAITRWFKITGVRIDLLRSRSKIPVLLDSIWPYGHPDWRWQPPVAENSQPQKMGSFTLNRHNEHVNGLFLDWSVRKIGIKELWTLKWHLQWDTSNPWTRAGGVQPEDWPPWMRGLKDY